MTITTHTMESNTNATMPQCPSVSCYICGSEKYTPFAEQSDLRFYPQDTFTIAKCNSCGLLFSLPHLSVHQLSKYYPTSYGAYGDDVEKFMLKYRPNSIEIEPRRLRYGRRLYKEIHGGGVARLVAKIRNSLARCRHVISGVQFNDFWPFLLPIKNSPGAYLHIGAGTGGRFVELLNEGWHVTAIDINEDLMRRWRACSPIETVSGQIKDAPFRPETFDVIFMSHVIEHLTDPVTELTLLNRWLKPDGVLVCALPLYGTLGFNLRSKYVYFDVPRHTMHFTRDTISQLLAKAGFIIRNTVVTPYWHGFYFADVKRCRLTGSPLDSTDFNVESVKLLPLRHQVMGYVSWLLRSSGNVCLYLAKS